MVNYCIGNVGSLRRSFRAVSGDGVISLDNEDVVADFKLNGKVYFVLGKIPCGNMSVAEYVSYSCALKTQLPLNAKCCKAKLRKAGYKSRIFAKLKKVSRVNYRSVMLAARLDDNTTCVYVNFGGIPYALRTARQIKRLLKRWNKKWNVFAGFSDYRFVPKKATPTVYLPEGEAKGKVKQLSEKVRHSSFKRALKSQGMEFKWAGATSVVKCDN